MTLEERMRRTARHECYHGAYAVSCGLEVEAISIHPNGRTTILWPFQPQRTWGHYQRDPLGTLGRLRAIVGTLCAPYWITENAQTARKDLAQLTAWRQRWNCVRPFSQPPGPTWDKLRAQAKDEVLAWHNAYNRKAQLDHLVEALLTHNRLDGQAWTALVHKHAHLTLPSWKQHHVAAR